MLKGMLAGVFGTRHDRERKRVQPIVDEINIEYERLQSVSDEELRSQTERFRERIREATGELEARVAELKEKKRVTVDAAEREEIDLELGGADGRGGVEGDLREATAAVLDELLPEAFATVREAARRLVGTNVTFTGQEQPWNMVHYDVQLMGGIQLHMGRIAEMATGEGKTLVATLPLYLNALPGKGAHLITVNSYLARRDSEWMGHIYKYLGLTVGCLDDTEPGTLERRAAYEADITYGTNNEFGFDYLRDNMKETIEKYVQRDLHYAIVDEVDSILIDEARTPLIISGPAEAASEKYRTLNEAIPQLRRDEHYNVDEKAFSVTLTDEGVELIQKLIGISNLYDPMNVQSLQTMVVAGLYSSDDAKNVQKFPGLAEVPLIGELFKSREFTDKKTELILQLDGPTPRISSRSSRKLDPTTLPSRSATTPKNLGCPQSIRMKNWPTSGDCFRASSEFVPGDSADRSRLRQPDWTGIVHPVHRRIVAI